MPRIKDETFGLGNKALVDAWYEFHQTIFIPLGNFKRGVMDGRMNGGARGQGAVSGYDEVCGSCRHCACAEEESQKKHYCDHKKARKALARFRKDAGGDAAALRLNDPVYYCQVMPFDKCDFFKERKQQAGLITSILNKKTKCL